MHSSVLLIEACDFEHFPVGGQLTIARQLMAHFGPRFALVGLSLDRDSVGKWSRREIEGHYFDFFNIGTFDPTNLKPLVPRRLSAYLRIRHFKRQILSLGSKSAYVVAPEVMLAIQHWGLRVAYNFCGVENVLKMPRYAYGRLITGTFEHRLFTALAKHCEFIMAAADQEAIEAMKRRSKGILGQRHIRFFPTQVDTRIFQPAPRTSSSVAPVFITCGRLNRVKGWDLILEAFLIVKQRMPGARLIYVGDGEDRELLEAKIRNANFAQSVTITGFVSQIEVARLLNTSNLFLMGSHHEGWPTALIEAQACGLPAVVTKVSGVADLIEVGVNGIIVDSRDPSSFAAAILRASRFDCPNYRSLEIASRYSIERQMKLLEKEWEPLAR